MCQRAGKVRAAGNVNLVCAGVAKFAMCSRRFGSPGSVTVVTAGACQGQTPDLLRDESY